MKTKRRSVLIADSDRALARMMRMHLERAGFLIYVAHDEEQAGILAARQRFDLIITNVGSGAGAFHGFNFCHYVREELGLAEVPIAICCTNDVAAETSDQIYKYGICKLVFKPVNPEAVMELANETADAQLMTV